MLFSSSKQPIQSGWCGKCKMIMPFVNQLSEDFGGVTFVKVGRYDS